MEFQQLTQEQIQVLLTQLQPNNSQQQSTQNIQEEVLESSEEFGSCKGQDNDGVVDEEVFIEELRKRVCVWDTRCRAYKDLTKKKQAWAELAHVFKKDVDSLKRLWKNLKDNFGKCLKNRIKMTRSGAAAETLPKCKLFDQLYFIKDTVANRPTISNIPQESQETCKIDQFTPPPSCSSDQRKRGFDDIFEDETPIKSGPSSKALINALREDSSKKSELDDPDVAFAHSIIPILKSLPAKKNRLVKVEIQQLLIKYEFEE